MSEIAFDIIKESIGSLTDDEAMNIFHDLREQFGWAGTVFTRADAEEAFQNEREDSLTGEMPDEVWEAVQGTWEWRRGLTDRLTEVGWEFVHDAIRDAIGG